MSYYPNQYPGGGAPYSPYGQQYPHGYQQPYGPPAHVHVPPPVIIHENHHHEGSAESHSSDRQQDLHLYLRDKPVVITHEYPDEYSYFDVVTAALLSIFYIVLTYAYLHDFIRYLNDQK
ncbi:unnamed protein product [Cylicocyclus nassatus]|uniref:Uncharacterized protein n=1 Tax=Cylicocyclus nassatus TaxID=53992 RepID=A0AA36GPD0_CYLNA|nr:unnamed protein product [Cylicocyclus nassatus]